MQKALKDFIRVKTLGKGAYGTVYEVQQSQENDQPYALKILSKRRMSKQPYLFDYLQGQIGFMEKMNQSQYLVKLIKWEQDDQNYYMLLEYCQGGDLCNLQLKNQNHVFQQQEAIQIMAQIIRGLQQVHQAGFLHRDIKLQNILMTKKTKRKIYKLADFGFTKKKAQIGGTILGTQMYMSPEVYGEDYGFEVDMWAFGVLFYYMLNKEFPFEAAHPLMAEEIKKKNLQKQAKNFSYKTKVQKSIKKLQCNCTEDMESLFKRIFQLDRSKRINFFQIRSHPIFIKHFPEVKERTSIIYKKGFNSTTRIPSMLSSNRFQANLRKLKQSKHVPEKFTSVSKITKLQQLLLKKKKEQIQFLIFNQTIFRQSKQISIQNRLSISCHLLKLILFLFQKLKQQMHSQKFWSKLKKIKPDWQSYLKNPSFKIFQAEINLQKCRIQVLYDQQLNNCKKIKDDLLKQNSRLFIAQKSEQQYDIFINSYRKCFKIVYDQLKCQYEEDESEKPYQYLLLLTTLSLYFDRLIEKQEKMLMIFHQFFQSTKRTVQSLNSMYLEQLRAWIINIPPQNSQIYGNITQKIFLSYA